MTLIFKGLVYQSSRLAVSGGLGVGIPTVPDTRYRVTDFLGDASDNDIEIQRQRTFEISNDTWSMSPFVAVLYTPTPRLYAQGFLQLDVPVNKSTIRYSEVALINTEPTELQFNPLYVDSSIREQTLLQTHLGVGYWLEKQPGSFLSGIVPTLELHYTTTLDNADIVTLPLATKGSGLAVVGPNGTPIAEPNPTVGNLRNRLDFLDMTVGSTFVFGDRATIASGVSFPLRGGDNRTYSWEYQLQINYYFGGPRGTRWAPNF